MLDTKTVCDMTSPTQVRYFLAGKTVVTLPSYAQLDCHAQPAGWLTEYGSSINRWYVFVTQYTSLDTCMHV